MRPVDSALSSPGGCTSICLMCLAQLGHCSTWAKCRHASSTGKSTVNSRRSSFMGLLACEARFGWVSRIIAPIPAGGFHFFFGNGTDIDLGLEPVENRAPAHVLAHDHGRAGPVFRVALADRFAGQVDAAVEVGFVCEVEGPAAITGADLPVREFNGYAQ